MEVRNFQKMTLPSSRSVILNIQMFKRDAAQPPIQISGQSG